MHHFSYKSGQLFAEGSAVAALAERFGTPLFVYSHSTLTRHIRVFREAFQSVPHLVCYSVKANPNLAVIRTLASQGAGADIVSEGELRRALAAGVDPGKIVFSGVGKNAKEIEAGIREGILCFNVEVDAELELISKIAQDLGKTAGVSLRVNPDVEAGTHEYIATGTHVNKFGIPMEEAKALYLRAAKLPGIEIRGVDCHIGSQLTEVGPFTQALKKVWSLVEELRAEGISIAHVDVGGGLGVRYTDESPPSLDEYAAAVAAEVGKEGVEVLFEPGRVLVANAGILVTRVLYRKEIAGKKFVIVDGAMNDFLRPALYGATHDIWPVTEETGVVVADVVGPVCETGDFFAKDCEVPDAKPGDLVVVMGAGAYGRTMSSNYNSRPRAAEVLVREEEAHLVQSRETLDELFAKESIPEFLR